MPFLIGFILLTLLAMLFYVGRMLFLAAGAPGGNFDAPSKPNSSPSHNVDRPVTPSPKT